jgi:hypothetical protein
LYLRRGNQEDSVMVEDKPTQDGSYINAKHIRGVLQPSYNVDVQSFG